MDWSASTYSTKPGSASEWSTSHRTSSVSRSLGFIVSCVEEAAAQGRIPRGLPVLEIGMMVMGTLLALVRFGEFAAGPAATSRAWTVIERLLGRK